MPLNLSFKKHVLKFKFDAGTSRGVLRTKDSWIIKIFDKSKPKTYGLGEVSIIERLSHDYQLDFDRELQALKEIVPQVKAPVSLEDIASWLNQLVEPDKPAIRFALETAIRDLLRGGKRDLFSNGFFQGDKVIPINGLVWMGDINFMQKQIETKIAEGFKCIKMKIGALDFEDEMAVLSAIRKKHGSDQLTLRVDANGGFTTQEVLKRLEALAKLNLHSIEQPIMPNQIQSMQLLCKKSNIPIALDEELIGIFGRSAKKQLLDTIKPHFIVLKPSLLGGFAETREWIELADQMGIGWWITSALESNVGLNAICQFTAEFETTMHQGLGTGQLYENNFHSPLAIQAENIVYHQDLSWDERAFEDWG